LRHLLWQLAALAMLAGGMTIPAVEPRVHVWGANFDGQTNVPPWLTNVKAIAAGYTHCLALRSNGTVVAWGDNSLGQTNGHVSLTNIVAVAAGQYHNLALRSNGTVFAWGFNNFGQLNAPAGLSNVVAIACGASHSLALRSNGTVVAWGNNFDGQTNVPSGLTNVAAIAAGDAHGMALRKNGTVVSWGDNDSSQTNTPVSLTNAMAIAAAYHHSLAVRSNGTVVVWGISDPNFPPGGAPIPPDLTNVVAVAGGHFSSLALRSSGTVVAWGENFEGQTNVPAGLNGVIAIAAGQYHDLALSTAPCPPGLPDSFECRQALSGSSISNVISNLGATREAGEPVHAGVSSSNSLWYSWTAPASGGVVIQVLGEFDFASPILAVYTGTNLATLTSVAFNVVAVSGANNPLNQARVVFTAVAGQTYQIAVDGRPTASFESEGPLTFLLNLTALPANDSFAGAIPIPGLHYQLPNGSFIGASREAGEPTHGTAHGQTLWWNWTAPTNLNVVTVPARLTADAVSFPPVFGLYTGNSAGALTPVALTQQTNGMSTTTTFSAVPGTTYRIALAGSQHDASAVLPLTGNFRFRFNTRALAVSVLNVTNTTTAATSVTFTATAKVENLGSALSSSLRVRATAVPGISMRGASVIPITGTNILQGSWLSAPLAPGQFTNLLIAGTVPAPSFVENGDSSGEGYGVYAELQEFGVSNNWTTVDQTLVLFGVWPELDGLPGPGGGVIRLDPGYVGLSGFDPLTGVAVFGPTNVVEGNQAFYFGRATYATGFQLNFTNTTWIASLFTATNGLFKSGIVTSNTSVSLLAKYSSSGFNFDATTNVTVLNLPAPVLRSPKLAGTNFTVRVEGVSNRVHVIEATTNLTAPVVWQSVGTNNLGATGFWNFTNAINSNPRRFFRAREGD
jgi:hypothetical protein